MLQDLLSKNICFFLLEMVQKVLFLFGNAKNLGKQAVGKLKENHLWLDFHLRILLPSLLYEKKVSICDHIYTYMN